MLLDKGDWWLQYNNGDPHPYMQGALAIGAMIRALADRSHLTDMDNEDAVLNLARTPVEIVSRVQRDCCRTGQRLVGGRAVGKSTWSLEISICGMSLGVFIR